MARDRRLWSLFFAVVLLFSAGHFRVVRCDSDSETDSTVVVDGGDLGIVGDDVQDFAEAVYGSAPGVETICFFPKNPGKVALTGEETGLLVGINNGGEAPLKIQGMRASVFLPFDHQYLVQNLTIQEFFNQTVPVSAQATFPYAFTIHKLLQPGAFDLVGMIVYEVDEQQYQSVFYNGTIEVVESGGLFSMESVFLFTLGVSLVGLLGLWAYGQLQTLSKKTKKMTKVEVGTRAIDGELDEWLEGTAYAQSVSTKKKKKAT